MQQALYEFELAEHLEDWYQGLQDDSDEFVFSEAYSTAYWLFGSLKRLGAGTAPNDVSAAGGG